MTPEEMLQRAFDAYTQRQKELGITPRPIERPYHHGHVFGRECRCVRCGMLDIDYHAQKPAEAKLCVGSFPTA